jgi:hypothetical protein
MELRRTMRTLISLYQGYQKIPSGFTRSEAFQILLFDLGLDEVMTNLFSAEHEMYRHLAKLASEDTLERFTALAKADSPTVDLKGLVRVYQRSGSFSLDNAKQYMRSVLLDHWRFYQFAAKNIAAYPPEVTRYIEVIGRALESKIARKLTEIFVCYRSLDKDDVKEFVDSCETHFKAQQRPYMRFWRDENELLPGADFYDEIRKEIERLDFAVIFISPQFWSSVFIEQQELPKLRRGLQRRTKTVVPILLDQMPEGWHEEARWLHRINTVPRHDTVRSLKQQNNHLSFYAAMAEQLHDIVLARSCEEGGASNALARVART